MIRKIGKNYHLFGQKIVVLSFLILLIIAMGNTPAAAVEPDDVWTSKNSMQTARRGFATAVVGGKIFGFGGAVKVGDTWPLRLASVEAYDPNTNSWTSKTVMPAKRGFFGAAVVNEKIYVIGGDNESGNTLVTVEEYDPVINTWATKTSMLTTRSDLAVAVVYTRSMPSAVGTRQVVIFR